MSLSDLYDGLLAGTEALSVVGLGYVGLPLAVAFARRVRVVGFDVNEAKVATYAEGRDPTGEAGDEAVAATSVEFTSDERDLRKARFHVVAVPTPVRPDHVPDLGPVESASHAVGRNLRPGSVVVYESTVWPGVTEDICVPILEAESGLECGRDFWVGYSPERINPGDRVHRLETITKVVSGMDAETLELVARVYSLVVEAGVHRAPSIRVAEAAKAIENAQRDINVAYVNELARVFDRLGIDTLDVLEAAGTKWNFLPFRPGLVGGHCIGVDPYYLTYKAAMEGYECRLVTAGRRLNDDMGRWVAEKAVKMLIDADRPVKGARVAVLGLTFKEGCPDVRNTRVVDILAELAEYGVGTVVVDPVADAADARRAYGVELAQLSGVDGCDAVIVAVAHEQFRALSEPELAALYSEGPRVLLDLKGVLDRDALLASGYRYWRM